MSQFISYGLGSGGGSSTYSDLVNNTTTTVGAGGTLTSPTKYSENFLVSGTAGPQTMSLTPFGVTAPIYDGTEITLIGTSSTNTVKVLFNDASKGCILNGDCILYRYGTLVLKWNATLDRYIELSRNQIGV